MRKNFTRLISQVTRTKSCVIALTSLMILAGSVYLMAAIQPITAVNLNATVDQAADAASPSFVPIGNVVIREQDGKDFTGAGGSGASYSLIIKATGNWQFNPNSQTSVALVANSGGNIPTSTFRPVLSADRKTLTFSLSGISAGSSPDVVTISGIEVQPISGIVALPSAGSVYIEGNSNIVGLSSNTTVANLTMTHGVANSISFTQQPSNTAVGATMAPSPSVSVRDQFSNIVTNASGSIGLTLSGVPSSALITSGVTALISNGVATFNNLRIDEGGNFQLRASHEDFQATSTNFVVNNNIPTVTAVSPCLTAGRSGNTITVTGANFVRGSVVRINGVDRVTSFVSTTSLNATLTAADLGTARTLSLTVFNPTPSGGSSNTFNLVVHPVYNVGAITGDNTVCENTQGVTYTVPNIGAAKYNWAVGPGATIVSGGTSNSITVNFSNTASSVAISVQAENACGQLGSTETLNVAVSAYPTNISAGNNRTICSGTQTTLGAGTAALSGYVYTWSAVNGAPISALSATDVANPTLNLPENTGTQIQNYTYRLRVSNSSNNDCFEEAEVTVGVYPKMVINVSPVADVCQGDEIRLASNGTANDTYAWTGPNNFTSTQRFPVITNAAEANEGEYTVIVTNPNGCKGTASTTVTVKPKPDISLSASKTAICEGESVELTASGANTYEWSGTGVPSGNTSSKITVTPSATTTYSVVGTTNGCESIEQTITIEVTPTLETGTITGTTAYCHNAPATPLKAQASGGGDATKTYTWERSSTGGNGTWSTVATTEDYTPLTTTVGTTYYRRTVKAGQCTLTTEPVAVTVSAIPGIPTVTGGEVCDSGPITLKADFGSNGTIVRWYSDATGGLPLEEGSSYTTPSLTTTTTYYASSYNGTTGCESARVSVKATVNELPTVSITTDLATEYCTSQAAITLAGSPSGEGGSFRILKNGTEVATGDSFNPGTLGAGTYIIEYSFTDGNTCTNTITKTVTVKQQPTVTVTADQEVCIGGSVSLTASGASTYRWEPTTGLSATTGATVTAKPTQTTTYTVYGATNGCESVAKTVTVTVNPLPDVTITPTGPTTFCDDSYVELVAVFVPDYTYRWFKTGSSTSVGSGSKYRAEETGSYYVTITTDEGCSLTSSTVAVKVADVPTKATISTIGSTTFCQGGSVRFEANKAPTGQTYIYEWQKSTDGNNFTSITNEESYFYVANAPGFYRVLVSNTREADETTQLCVRTSEAQKVTVLPQPTANITTQGSTICQNTEGPTTFAVTGTYFGGTGAWTVTNGFTYTETSTSTDAAGLTTSTITVTAPSTVSSTISTVVSLTTSNSASNCATQTENITVTVQQAIAGNTIIGTTEYCQGASASALRTSTTLAGGNGASYSYQWQQSASLNGPWTTADGTSTSATYTPSTADGGTTYYRRLVSSGQCTNDESNVIAVTVTPTIVNNISTATTTYCQSAVADDIRGAVTGGNGSDSYTYTWQSSASANGTWTTISGATAADYTPATTVAGTTYYKRIVTSGNCANKESNVIAITVNPSIVNNISGTSNYCQNATASAIGGAVSGGNGTYSYSWRVKSGIEGNWGPIGGNEASLIPSTAQAGEYYYKRIVTSGACINDESNEFKVTVTPTITQNTIAGKLDYCKGEPGQALSGAVTGGDGSASYIYTWQTSSTGADNTWTSINNSNSPTYTPQTITANTTYYRRGVTSGNCTTYSTAVMVTVTETISNNTITTTAPVTGICTGTSPGTLNGTAPTGGNGTYTFVWQRSTTSATAGFSDIASTNVKDYNPGNLTATTWFRREVRSENCESVSPAVQVVVNPVIANNTLTTADLTVCTGTSPGTLNGTAPTGGNGTYTFVWQRSTTSATAGFSDIASTNVKDYNPGNLTATTWFRRKVISGGCENITTLAVKVTVTPQITGNSIAGTQTVCSGATIAPLGQAPNTTLSGGFNNSFQWEQRVGTTGNWTAIANATAASYTPPVQTVTSTTTTYYRRVVSGGECSNTSVDVVYVSVNPLPAKPTITNLASTYYTGDAPVTMVASPSNSTGTFRVVNSTGQTVSTTSTFAPCSLGAGTYTVTYTYTAGGCSNTSDPVTVRVIQSIYKAVVTSSMKPFCRGDNVTHTVRVWRDAEVIYPYLTNAAGDPVRADGSLVGPQEQPVANPNFEFPANTPDIIKQYAWRYFDPIVRGGTEVTSGVTYQWTKNQEPEIGNNGKTLSNAGLSSLDYYAVYVTVGGGSCGPNFDNRISSRAYTAEQANYNITLSASPNPVCQGQPVTFTATLQGNFPWISSNLQLNWMVNGVTMNTTAYTGNNAELQWTTTNLKNGDVVSIDFNTDIEEFDRTSKCRDRSNSNTITMTVNDIVAATATPKSPSVCLNGSETFSVNVTSTGVNAVSYAWTVGTAPNARTYNTTTSSLTIGTDVTATPGTYPVSVVVSNICESIPLNLGSLTVKPAITPFAVAGGGSYCTGSPVSYPITLSDSEPGVRYTLLRGTTVVQTLAGTGEQLNFTPTSVTGTYTVRASYATAPACTVIMTGNATISTNPLPNVYSVTGGGAYCAGAAGVTINLSGSQTGVLYSLKKDNVEVRLLNGTGGALSFTGITEAGSYTIEATTAAPASCPRAMNGEPTVYVTALPTRFDLTGGGSYCAGGAGVAIGLEDSEMGIRYELFLNGSSTPVATITGTGSAINFGNQTAVGTYTVRGTSISSATVAACSQEMGKTTVSMDDLPEAITAQSGSYCETADGVDIILPSSQPGVLYQLVSLPGNTDLGDARSNSTGGAINFGTYKAGSYKIVASNISTGCSRDISVPEIVANPIITATGEIYIYDADGNRVDQDEIEAGKTYTFEAISNVLDNGDTDASAIQWFIGSDENWGNPVAYGPTFTVEMKEALRISVKCEIPLNDGVCYNWEEFFILSIEEIIPLPVELLYFNAIKRGNDVVLDWATASELDNKGFEVQVSSDAKNFRVLGFVESKVNTTSLKQLYTFVDKENGKQGVRYYRLKQVDLDGKSEIFNIKAVHFDVVSANKVKAYPNPFHSEVELSIDAELDGELQITVTTATGQQLLQRTVQVAKGTNIEKLTLDPNLPRGVYIISTRMGDFNSHFKLLKQ